MTQGIYKLVNTVNEQMYVGQSINIEQRFKEHIGMLEGNKHHAYKLQEFYNKNKAKKGFKVTYGIIEEIDNEKHLNAREKHYIDFYDAHKNGFNSIGLDGSPTHTKQRARTNKKVDKLNREKEIYSDLISEYKNNLYLQYDGYNGTFLYRVNEAIEYFVKNYNLDLYMAEINQYKSEVSLIIVNKDFHIVQEHQYITKNKCMGLHKYTYKYRQDQHIYSKRYEKFANIMQSQNRFKYFLNKFHALDGDIIKHNTLKYSKNKYSIPVKVARKAIGYEYDKFRSHIVRNSEIQGLSKKLGITYPHGRIELNLNGGDIY